MFAFLLLLSVVGVVTFLATDPNLYAHIIQK